MSWIYQLVYERIRAGGLAVPPPVLTRVFAILSDGMLGYEQCRKIMDTPFPFPWAQLIVVLLASFTVWVPLVVVRFVNSTPFAALLSFFAVMAYWALHEVARDLEDPFVYDPNDLPLARIQYAFNERVIALSHNLRPASTLETSDMHVTVLPEMVASRARGS